MQSDTSKSDRRSTLPNSNIGHKPQKANRAIRLMASWPRFHGAYWCVQPVPVVVRSA